MLLPLAFALLAAVPPNRAVSIREHGRNVAAGALITQRHVLTAAHVLDPGQRSAVVGCAAASIPALVSKVSEEHDLALLELAVPCLLVDVTPISPVQAEEGSQVMWQGYPGGEGRKTMRGTISAYESVDWDKNRIRFVMVLDGRVIPGHSGGPVLAGDAMLLVGLVTGVQCYHETPQCVGVAVPLSIVSKFLEG